MNKEKEGESVRPSVRPRPSVRRHWNGSIDGAVRRGGSGYAMRVLLSFLPSFSLKPSSPTLLLVEGSENTFLLPRNFLLSEKQPIHIGNYCLMKTNLREFGMFFITNHALGVCHTSRHTTGATNSCDTKPHLSPAPNSQDVINRTRSCVRNSRRPHTPARARSPLVPKLNE